MLTLWGLSTDKWIVNHLDLKWAISSVGANAGNKTDKHIALGFERVAQDVGWAQRSGTTCSLVYGRRPAQLIDLAGPLGAS